MVQDLSPVKSEETQSNSDKASPVKTQKPNLQEAPNEEPEELLDDSTNGITFSSFEIVDILGEGSFGKVYKVKLKSDPSKVYAMKVLSKQYLVRNNHLKYAISECNILKQTSHPFVLKMHYSF